MTYENLPEIVKKWKTHNWTIYFDGGHHKFSKAENNDINDYYTEYLRGLNMEDETNKDKLPKKDSSPFFKVDDFLFTLKKEKKINWFDILLYGKIKGLCHKHGYCWASNPHLVEYFGVCKKTIQDSLATLEKNKLIKRKINYSDKPNHVESRHITITPIKKLKNEQKIPKMPEEELGMDSIDGML